MASSVCAKLREDALCDAPRRLALLEAHLGLLSLQGGALPADAKRELATLEQLVAGEPLSRRVVALRRVADACEAAPDMVKAPRLQMDADQPLFAPMPEAEAGMLCAAGEEAQRRLLAKLADESSWSRVLCTLSTVWQRPSDVRSGGLAFATAFTLNRPASNVFKAVQSLDISGALHPGCNVRWSRSVGTDNHTVVRHIVLGRPSGDFFCICRGGAVAQPEAMGDKPGWYRVDTLAHLKAGVFLGSTHLSDLAPGRIVRIEEVVDDDVARRVRARVADPPGWISLLDLDSGARWAERLQPSEVAAAGANNTTEQVAPTSDDEQFVVASMSLGPKVMSQAGVVQRQGEAQESSIYTCGVSIRGSSGACRVQVMADMRPAGSAWAADRDVRGQVLSMADTIWRELAVQHHERGQIRSSE